MKDGPQKDPASNSVCMGSCAKRGGQSPGGGQPCSNLSSRPGLFRHCLYMHHSFSRDIFPWRTSSIDLDLFSRPSVVPAGGRLEPGVLQGERCLSSWLAPGALACVLLLLSSISNLSLFLLSPCPVVCIGHACSQGAWGVPHMGGPLPVLDYRLLVKSPHLNLAEGFCGDLATLLFH